MNDKQQEQQIQTAIRLPESVLDRADKVAERMSRPGLRVTRADVLRLATHQGLDQLEAEGKSKR